MLAGLLLPACGGPDLGVDRVVVISLDTLRVDHLGAYNPDVETTPHLDAIAAEGVRFENAYAPVPLTLPSHTSLFTGRSPLQTRVMANGDQVPEDIPALAEIFRDHGFATGAFVSLGVLNDNFGLARGFDAYNLDLGDTGRWYRSADEVFEPAWAWVEEHRDDPFLLWVHYSDAHEPYASKTFPPDLAVELDGEVLGEYRLSLKENLDVAFELPPGRHTLSFRSLIPEPTRRERGLWLEVRNATEVQPWLFESEGLPAGEVPIHPALDLELLNSGADPVAVTVAFKGRWKHPPPGVVRREYALEVAYVDRYVGELRNRMAAAGLDERTLWLVVSDHGEGLYRHNALGHAAAVWEDQLRIAWFMSGPGLPAGEVYSGLPARMEDVAPTLLGHLGMKVPKGVDGIDLHGCWSGEGCPRIPPRWSFGINDKGVLTGVAGYDWPYKWMWFRGRDRVFGLDIDPWESRRGTIAHDAPADVLSLGRQAERYRQVVTEGLERRSRREPTPEEIEMLRNLGYL
ncbi:MAG: sulfatase [Thermoanaerobaculia bacterium]|nr:sulfatase [Thermoanaerobaculia bacterium]